MTKFVWLAVLACLACRLLAGRWPWQLLAPHSKDRDRINRARRLLGVPPGASRRDVLDAHRRLLGRVHPDRGGSSEHVHQANDARDLLLNDIQSRSNRP